MRLADLGGKRVALLGFGREGRAVHAALRKRAPWLPLSIFCEQEPEDRSALDAHGDRLVVGPLAAQDLRRFEVLVKSPGISLYHPAVAAARAAGVHVTSGTNLWFAERGNEPVVCVTGTKGKSTTASLIASMLGAAGRRVALGGNVGLPMIELLEARADIWVIELSSFQIADLQAQPALGVLLNLYPDHLDWHGDFETYQRDKLRLLSLAGRALVNRDFEGLAPRLTPTVWFNDPDGLFVGRRGVEDAGRLILPAERCPLPGRHNLANVGAALAVADFLGVERTVALAAVEQFNGLPHRLQTVATEDGLRYVDDSIATTPMATARALEAFPGQPVTLLAGGFERGVSWAPVLDTMAGCPPHAVIALPDTGACLLSEMTGRGIEPPGGVHAAADLEQAVALARRISRRPGVVLLSPGAASFNQFRDFMARGRRFAELVV